MNEYKFFRLFDPTEEKLAAFGRRLMDDYLYLSDEDRNVDSIQNILAYYLADRRHNVVWEIGDFDGLMVFANIVPGHKASLVFKLWNPKRWGADLLRECRAFIDENMTQLHLVRLESLTADPRVMKMARMAGFEVEGIKEKSFSWRGDLFDEWVLGLIKEGEDGVLSGATGGMEGLDIKEGVGGA